MMEARVDRDSPQSVAISDACNCGSTRSSDAFGSAGSSRDRSKRVAQRSLSSGQGQAGASAASRRDTAILILPESSCAEARSSPSSRLRCRALSELSPRAAAPRSQLLDGRRDRESPRCHAEKRAWERRALSGEESRAIDLTARMPPVMTRLARRGRSRPGHPLRTVVVGGLIGHAGGAEMHVDPELERLAAARARATSTEVEVRLSAFIGCDELVFAGHGEVPGLSRGDDDG